MALNARRTMNIHNNQPKKGGRDGGYDGGEVRRAGHAGEARYHHFGGVVSRRRGIKIKGRGACFAWLASLGSLCSARFAWLALLGLLCSACYARLALLGSLRSACFNRLASGCNRHRWFPCLGHQHKPHQKIKRNVAPWPQVATVKRQDTTINPELAEAVGGML